MSLTKYRQKRNFNQTPEPIGEPVVKRKKEGNKEKKDEPIFVVQKHQASHLHWDFRIEHKGVLLSWAVPKEPPTEPGTKRLAIHVEDHPLDYANFAGTIPEGEYGAGEVEIWDSGTYSLVYKTIDQGLDHGHVHINLHGKRLSGEYSLIKLHDGEEDNWLLFKNQDDDEHVVQPQVENLPAEIEELVKKYKLPKLKRPGLIKPMLAELKQRIPTSGDWIYELKYDGYRMLAQTGDNAQLYSRNLKSYTKEFPEIIEQLKAMTPRLVLDGEIVVLDKEGRSDFALLQNYLSTGNGNPVMFVFDILRIEDYDLKGLQLKQRKKILSDMLLESNNVKRVSYITSQAKDFFELAKSKSLEGIIAKDANSKYLDGDRSDKWRKIKTVQEIEAYIAGYTEPKGRGLQFGALVLATKKGSKFTHIGEVGTGFGASLQKQIKLQLDELVTQDPVVDVTIPGKKVTWLQPKLKAKVKYTEFTSEGKLRHPRFVEILGEEFDPPSDQDGNILNVDGIEVELTNLSKVFWPESGYTKGDLIDYYAKISATLLPYLEGRPMSLHRHPNGINQESFFQKDVDHHPKWMHTKPIFSKSANRTIDYVVVKQRADIIYLAQLGSIELNPWHSRAGNINKPDYMIIDLDPHEIEFSAVIEIAKTIKKICDNAQIPAFCKTSGMKGLHIYIPLGAKYSYEQSLEFAKVLAAIINSELPEITSNERSPENRKGKVYLDIYQNPRGQTVASVYSVRPFPGAPISTPLEWSEINSKLTPTSFHIKNIHSRLAKIGDIWEPVLGKGIDMASALGNLQQHYEILGAKVA